MVWETGLGGRLDSTRAMPADLCVLTTVSLEHTAILGDTIEAIAKGTLEVAPLQAYFDKSF